MTIAGYETHPAADLFPMLDGTCGAIGSGEGTVVQIAPSAVDGFHWVSVVRGSVEEWTRRPMRSSAVSEFLRRAGVSGLTWHRQGLGPAAACPFGGPPSARRELIQEVYLARQVGGVGPIKIGCSSSAWSRLATLQAGSPVALELLASFPGGVRRERELHRRFAPLRLHGEWFRAEGDLLRFLDEARGEATP